MAVIILLCGGLMKTLLEEMHMNRPVFSMTVLALVFGAGVAVRTIVAADAPAAPQFKLLKTIAIGGEGRWDYLAFSAETRQLFIPRSTHTQVLNLDKGNVSGDIADTSGVHGVALVADKNLGVASNGKANTVTAFDLKTLKAVATLKAGDRPDAIVYDPASKHVFAMNHAGGDITVIDPAALDQKLPSIAVGGTLEFAVTDNAGHLFVNVEDKSEIAEIDTATNKVLARWTISPGEEPTGLAIDVKNHRLFSGCGNQKMIILDSVSGKIVATCPIGKGVDGVAFDDTLNLAMAANGQDGTVTLVREDAPDKFEVVQTVQSIKGARTITLDPKNHHALLPCNVPDGKGGQTFGIAVVGPEAGK